MQPVLRSLRVLWCLVFHCYGDCASGGNATSAPSLQTRCRSMRRKRSKKKSRRWSGAREKQYITASKTSIMIRESRVRATVKKNSATFYAHGTKWHCFRWTCGSLWWARWCVFARRCSTTSSIQSSWAGSRAPSRRRRCVSLRPLFNVF